MVNTPPNTGQNWDDIIPLVKKNVQNKLQHVLGVEIDSLIEFEEILDPRTIESKRGGRFGSLYGAASNEKMSAFKRHSNFSNKGKVVYFVGGTVHPGGGIPLCLKSAEIISKHV